MTTVFLGGSRSLPRLSADVQRRLENLMQKNYTVLVGDANGADKAMQAFLASTGYRNVEIFCMEGVCRNNVGGWNTVAVPSQRGAAGAAYYTLKDEAMSNGADCGFMLWDGASKGTLNNVLNLAKRSKATLVYFAPQNRFITVKDRPAVEQLIALCPAGAKQGLEKAFGFTASANNQSALELA